MAAPDPMFGIEIVDSPGMAAHAINQRGDVVGAFAEWPCGDHAKCPPEQRHAVWPHRGSRMLLSTLGTLPALALKAPGAQFDRSVGQLTDYVIPLP